MTIKDKVQEMIKGHDLFAHEVKFGLSNGNDSHATMIGSIFSLIIKVLMLYYIRNLFL